MKTILKIEGMHCAGCAGSIERALRRVDGVKNATADLQRKRVTVEHAPRTGEDQLVGLLRDIGFAASVSNHVPRPER
jgi:copper chaperone CopZ